MRSSFAAVTLFICLTLSVWGTALSQETPKQAPPKPAPAHQQATQKTDDGQRTLGEVVKVDLKAKQIVIRTKAGEKQLDVSNAQLAGYAALSDVKAGDKLAILYTEKGGKLIAQAIANHDAMMKMGHPPAK